MSNVLIDVDDYLEGYGEDYGEKTDDKILASAIFDQKKKRKDKSSSNKKKAKKNKKHNKEKDTKLKTEDVKTTTQQELQPVTTSPINVPVISVEAEVLLEEYEDDNNNGAMMIREEGEGQEAAINNIQQQSLKDTSRSQDSIDAHPSYESLLDNESNEEDFISQEREAGEGKEEEDHLSLPQETQHYLERVTQLQQSTVEYEKEHGFEDIHEVSILIIYEIKGLIFTDYE